MTDTTTRPTAESAAAPTDAPRTRRRQPRWVFAVLGGGLLFETLVLALAGERTPDLGHLVFLGLWLWWAIPFVLAALLTWFASGRAGVSWRLTAGLAVALTLSGLGAFVQMRLSPDASLIGLSGPLVQDAAVVLVGVVVGLREVVVRRRSR